MNSQIDELLIMPISAKNQIKVKGKDYLNSCVHSKCIIIMI